MRTGKQWFDHLSDTNCDDVNHAQGAGHGPRKYCAQCVAEAFDAAITEAPKADALCDRLSDIVRTAFSFIPGRKDERMWLIQNDILDKLRRVHAKRSVNP